jgi:hypothetical protein
MIVLLIALPISAARLNGTLKLGTISLDEEAGDLAAMQETYNIHDGFSVSQVLLNGQLSSRSFFMLNLEEINLDSRKGLLSYRVTDLGQLNIRHDKHRQLFDAGGAVVSEREDWHFGASVTPADWLSLTGASNIQVRDGERLDYPIESASFLGNRYDYTLSNHRFEAEVHKDGRALAIGYETSDLSDDLLAGADRSGRIFSARVHGKCLLFPIDLSHYARVAFGKQELSDSNLDHTLSAFQYVGTVKPHDRFHLSYKLHLNRIDDDATDLRTDYIRNDFDLTYRHRYGRVFGGYGYVTNDDDRTLTSYDTWHLGTAFRYEDWVRAKISYASSNKTAEEDLTLLKDVEDSRFKASVQSRPVEELTVGASFVDRMREFPAIDVKADGKTVSTFARLAVTPWGALSADYSYSDEDYDDRAGGFQSESHTVTGRVDFEAIEDLRLSAGLTYLDIGKDLDIEKSVLMFEGRYDLLEDYFVEVKYNVYNYDDYVLLDRYYTANVVWVNFGYRLSLE